MRIPIAVDLHVPSFTYPGIGTDRLFAKLVEIATTIERSGFTSISVMDHLHQISGVGPPENYMLEGSTLLAAIAARTHTLTLGLLVGSVTYRNPALAAKITSTVDLISGGRAWHGIGAGWFEAEHDAYGFEFPALKVRFEMLEEALQIQKAMFRGEPIAFEGRHFRVEQPLNNPRPIRGDIPVLIGGSGERKTLRLVAQYGDGCNLFAAGPDRLRHLIGVLEGHCEAVGRDPGEITKTILGRVSVATTHERAQAQIARLRERGVSEEVLSTGLIGDPDSVGEAMQELKDAGAEGICFSVPDVWDAEALELAGRTAAAVFGD